MAKVYLSSDNSRGNPVTTSEPTFAHIRGWNAGVRVEASRDGTEFRIYATHGSYESAAIAYLGTVRETPLGPVFEPKEGFSG